MKSAHVLVLALVLATVLAACGGNDTGSARDVAETYVNAVSARDWKTACEVSVRDRMNDCVGTLRKVYSDIQRDTPTVERTQEVVEEVDGRNLVHFEYVLIE